MKILLGSVEETLDFWIFIESSQSFAFFIFVFETAARAQIDRGRKSKFIHDSLPDKHRENHFLKFWWRLYDSVKSYPCPFDSPKKTVYSSVISQKYYGV